jgi:hypothetical protein
MKKEKSAPWRPAIRILPSLPLEIYLWHRPPLVSQEKTQHNYVFKCSFGPSVDATITAELIGKNAIMEEMIGKNVYQIRDEFFRANTPAEVFEFLSSYSDFLQPLRENEESVLLWADFQRWQQLLKEISLHRFPMNYDGEFVEPGWRFFRGGRLPEELQSLFSANLPETTLDWLQGIASHIDIRKHEPIHLELHPDDGPGKCTVIVHSIVEAILATIYFNDLVGIKYERCLSEGCEEIFEVRTSHERRYCSNKCAHTQGTRVRRLAAKEKAAKEKAAAEKAAKKKARKKNG